jgi:hypothetical protein
MKQCNIGEWWGGNVTPFILKLRHYMEVKVQVLASAAILPGKNTQHLLDRRLGEAHSRYSDVVRENSGPASVSNTDYLIVHFVS